MSPTDTTAVDFPPVVYVPCTRHTAEPEELEVRYQTTKDGRRAVLPSAPYSVLRPVGSD